MFCSRTQVLLPNLLDCITRKFSAHGFRKSGFLDTSHDWSKITSYITLHLSPSIPLSTIIGWLPIGSLGKSVHRFPRMLHAEMPSINFKFGGLPDFPRYCDLARPPDPGFPRYFMDRRIKVTYHIWNFSWWHVLWNGDGHKLTVYYEFCWKIKPTPWCSWFSGTFWNISLVCEFVICCICWTCENITSNS